MLLRLWFMLSALGLMQVYAQEAFSPQSDLMKPLELPSKLSQPQIIRYIHNHQDAIAYCHQQYGAFLPEHGLWQIQSVKQSPAGVHYTFNATYEDRKINGLSIKIHCRHDGSVQYIQEQTTSKVLNVKTIENSTDLLYHDGRLLNGSLIHRDIEGISHRIFSDQEGNFYDLGTVKLFYRQQDTPVYMYVFNPNPVVSQQTAYGGLFKDFGDADNDSLTAARMLKRTNASYIGDRFYLRNGYLRFGHVSDPVVSEINSKSDTFDFTRSQQAFEQVNAFYHLNEMSEYLKNIGFSSLLDTIIIDAHAFNGDDLSAFDPSVYPYTLEYGEGGVDDAEDAQVVIHEFGHSLSTVASPGTVNGSQRRAMEEGNADYVCMSYSRGISEFARDEVFSWDGHNEFWNGFTVGSAKKYPQDLKGNSNNDREIWSTALMCIWDQLGKSRSDSLILSHLFYQASNATMPQMAQIILDLNRDLFGNEKHWAIQNCFAERGILGWSDTEELPAQINQAFLVLNSDGFARNESPLRISLSQHMQWQCELIDLHGKIRMRKEGTDASVIIEPNGLGNGVYMLRLRLNGAEHSIKLLRF